MKKLHLWVLGLLCGILIPLITYGFVTSYSVVFISDGVEISSGFVNTGEVRTGTIPTPAEKDGYKFEYRYLDGNPNTGFNFSTPITEFTLLHAKWTLTADIPNGIYTGLSGGDKTVVYKSGAHDIKLTIAGESLPGTYQRGTMSPSENFSMDDNAWGGGDDMGGDSGNERYKRQGPCSSGYHVPSAQEWSDLVIAWCSLDDDCSFDEDDFQDYGYEYGFLYDEDEIGFGTKFKEVFNIADSEYYFWSSSPIFTAEHEQAYVADIEEESIIPAEEDNRYYDGVRVRCFKNYLTIPPTTYTLTFDSQGGSKVDTGMAEENTSRTRPENPTKSGYIFVDWYTSTGYDTVFDFTGTMANGDLTVYAKWGCETGFKDNGTECVINKDIVLEATSTAANQTLTINKYFANDYTVDWGDGSSIETISANKTHTYTTAGTYTITLSLSGADRWTFTDLEWGKNLVPNWTTMTGVKIVSMPSLADGFGESATNPGDCFFANFNGQGALTSLPEGSFDTSSITTVGDCFFASFNLGGALTSLPKGSFDISNISGTVGSDFFAGFNNEGALTSLPTGSFNISNITTVGNYFFNGFNAYGALESLPEGSFDTTKITTVGFDFFSYFNGDGALTSLPTGSFNISNISGSVEQSFFNGFNSYGALTSLPTGSFDTSNISGSVGRFFFDHFNEYGQLTSLPIGSFDISKITTVGNYFFHCFNYEGALTSLPEGSFDTSNITTVGLGYFRYFNKNGALTSLPTGSFNISNISGSVEQSFFESFNGQGALTSLPKGSFDTSKITAVGDSFFESFNGQGALTSLPEGSFDTSKIVVAGNYFFRRFNYEGALTSLPEGSFTISSNITGWYDGWEDGFFAGFNTEGAITDLPDSFKLSSVGASVSGGGYSYNYPYDRAFDSPNYTLNKKVSDLVSGHTAPLNDRNTFSDNQPGRCGVHENWLVTPATACKTVTFVTNSESTVDSQVVDIDANEKVVKPADPTKTGHTFTGWYSDENLTELFDFSTVIADDTTLYAKWKVNEYTITLDIDGTLTAITGDYGRPVDKPANPIKNGYTFKGWEPEIPDTMPAEDMTVKAKWERNGSSGGGGGGGGSSSSSSTGSNTTTGSDNSNNTGNQQTGSGANSSTGTQNEQPTTGTKVKEPEANTGSNIQTGNQVDSLDNSSEGQEILSPSDSSFTKEQKDAYEFAKGHGITTMPTIQKAEMNSPLTRIAMAKMLSQYAMNVLGQKPSEVEVPKFNDVTDKQNSDYDNGVTLAYQLGIMGQNMPNNNFRPEDEVTRAEFATALSRMLYNTSDGKYKSTSEYYVNHMKKLKEEGIITKDDPKMKELRGYVMIMLMRSAK